MSESAGSGWLDRLRSWRAKSLLLTVLIVAVGAAVAAQVVEFDRLLTAVRTANPGLLALAAVLYVASWPLRGRRYDDILAVVSDRCGVRFQTAIVFLSQTANLVVPARAGDGARAYLLNQRRGVPYATGGASLAVERLFDLLALTAFGVAAAAGLLVTGRAFAPGETATYVTGATMVAAGALAAMGTIVVLARSNREFGSVLRTRVDHPRLQRLVEGIVQFGADLRVVAARPRALGQIGALSLAIWALDVFTAVVVLASLAGETLTGPALVVVGTLAVTVGNLAKVLPLSQGGIGLYEAAFTALVVAASPVGPAVALAAALLDHGLKNVVTLAGGAVAAVGLNTSPRDTTGDVEPADTESPDF